MMSVPALAPDLDEEKKWWLIRCANDFRVQMLTLLTFALLLNREGDRVPSGNELVYLLYFFKAYHPHLLSTDWTFQETTAGHGFFNHATGWVTLFMPLEWGAWVGRFASWTLAFVGLLRVGRHFKIPPWTVWACVLLWLVQRQAVPTTAWTEWMIGSFEAKCPAYVCLLFAVDFAVRDKPLKAGLLAGLAFSFHTAVGLWGGAALGWAVMLHNPLRRTAWYCGGVIVASLPGLISSWPLVMGAHAISADDSRFLVTTALPLVPGSVHLLQSVCRAPGRHDYLRGVSPLVVCREPQDINSLSVRVRLGDLLRSGVRRPRDGAFRSAEALHEPNLWRVRHASVFLAARLDPLFPMGAAGPPC